MRGVWQDQAPILRGSMSNKSSWDEQHEAENDEQSKRIQSSWDRREQQERQDGFGWMKQDLFTSKTKAQKSAKGSQKRSEISSTISTLSTLSTPSTMIRKLEQSLKLQSKEAGQQSLHVMIKNEEWNQRSEYAECVPNASVIKDHETLRILQ